MEGQNGSLPPTFGSIPIEGVRRAPDQEIRARVAARQAFNAGFVALQNWLAHHPQAEPDEVWTRFSDVLAPAFAAQGGKIWLAGVNPRWRQPMAHIFATVAWCKMRLDAWSDPRMDDWELRLWQAARLCSPLSVRQWENAQLDRDGELAWGYVSVSHRLADLHRRSGHTSNEALRLYIDIFIGSHSATSPPHGAGSRLPIADLLQTGAAIVPSMDETEIAHRYSLCLLLWNRGFRAPWVEHSLQLARQRVPSGLFARRAQERLAQQAREREQHKYLREQAAKRPLIAQLTGTLSQLAIHGVNQQERAALLLSAWAQQRIPVKQIEEALSGTVEEVKPGALATVNRESPTEHTEAVTDSVTPKRRRTRRARKPKKSEAQVTLLTSSQQQVFDPSILKFSFDAESNAADSVPSESASKASGTEETFEWLNLELDGLSDPKTPPPPHSSSSHEEFVRFLDERLAQTDLLEERRQRMREHYIALYEGRVQHPLDLRDNAEATLKVLDQVLTARSKKLDAQATKRRRKPHA